ncbi:DNA polymerase III subunit gamma/tau, partial [Pontibaca methylaminivorans]|uniref:DNA polymerase III subunit gamma/tau n=1 Tax=Pontibaca methylaminivorans TaxID=515897 RepID=UPI002FD8FFBD
MSTPAQTRPEPAYQVLARKYRPETFADLIGQDAMVRTLKHAFEADRIAQAFILTGIRGTGKTSTARIIAKGLNCTGPDGQGGPTITPCGICEHCRAISEGRHVDVQEMDAASHTGVQNIRDAIIETVSYRAASARYRIFIIDEVHMLSTSAFNALLKTLEEPPAHVKFIFATTEIRKVPVTDLSRCQRIDLRRIEPE